MSSTPRYVASAALLLAIAFVLCGLLIKAPLREPLLWLCPIYVLLLAVSLRAAFQSGLERSVWQPARLYLIAEWLSMNLLVLAIALAPAWLMLKAGRGLFSTLLAAVALLGLVILRRDAWLMLTQISLVRIDTQRLNTLRRSLAQAHAIACAKLAHRPLLLLIGSALLLALLLLPIAPWLQRENDSRWAISWLGYAVFFAPSTILLLLHVSTLGKLETPTADDKSSDEENPAWRTEPHVRKGDSFNAIEATGVESESSDADAVTLDLQEPLQDRQLRLLDAIAAQDLPAVRTALAAGADPNLALEQGRERRTPLVFAASIGHAPIARELLAAGADVNRISMQQTALMAATQNSWTGRLEMVITLVTNGADVKAQASDGNTSLHYAASCQDVAVMQQLIDAGARLDVANTEGLTPIAAAAMAANRVGVETLLTHITKGDESAWADSLSPLIALAQAAQDEPELGLLLLQYCRPERLDLQGRSALHACAVHELPELCTVLLGAGAQVNLGDVHGATPLMLAAQAGSRRVLHRLLMAQANVLQIDAQQESVLHYLVRAEQPDLDSAQRLLSTINAPSGVFDRQRQSASEAALARQYWDLARVLSPTRSLSDGLEQALETHVGVKPPDRNELLKEAVRLNRIAVATALMKLGASTQSVLHECVVLLGDRLDEAWLSALRSGGLQIGSSEREPLLPLLARQLPCPEGAIAQLLQQGASLLPDSEGDSVLTLLAGAALDYGGQTAPAPGDICNVLLLNVIKQADAPLLQHVDASGRCALAWAGLWANAEIIATLMTRMAEVLDAERLGALLNQRDESGQTILLNCLRRADFSNATRLSIVQQAIRLGADPQQNGADGQSPRALALGYADVDAELLQLLAWPSGAHPRRPLRDLDIPRAARHGEIVTLRRLLTLGLDVNSLDEDSCSAIAHAAGQGNQEMLTVLLEHNADPNQGEQTALHCALRLHARAIEQATPDISQRAAAICEQLLAGGADASLTLSGLDALGLAGAMLDIDAVRLLLRARPKLAAQTTAALPALHAIAIACYFDVALEANKLVHVDQMIEELLSAGADINQIDTQGQTALHVVFGLRQNTPPQYGAAVQSAIAKLFIDKGANVQARDSLGRCALHACCQHRLIDAARVLLEAGADPYVADRAGKQPVDLAGVLDRFDFLALFRGDSQ